MSLTVSKVMDAIKKELDETLGVRPELVDQVTAEITAQKMREVCGMDSLDEVELMMAVEDRLGVDIDYQGGLPQDETLRDIAQRIVTENS